MKLRSLLVIAVAVILCVMPLSKAGFAADFDSSAEAVKPDARLEQKVTSEVGYTRLHYVVEEISKASGVTVRCGKSEADWNVRDIPVIVLVKDMPLGKLLHALADATHTEVFRKDSDNGPPSYRIYRNAKLEKEISQPLNAEYLANTALANWEWDVLAAFADAPNAPIKLNQDANTPPEMIIDPKEVKLVGQMLKMLGPEVREKAFSGEKTIISASSSPEFGALLKELLIMVCKRGNYMNWGKAVPPTADEAGKASLVLRTNLKDGYLGIDLIGVPTVEENGQRQYDIWDANPELSASLLSEAKELQLPPKPDIKELATPKERYPQDAVVMEKEDDWKLEELQREIELKLPEKTEPPTRVDVLNALHTASGLNIVCEDFYSHTYNNKGLSENGLEQKPTIADVMKPFSTERVHKCPWFFNKSDNLLLGWTDDWRKHHLALVSEAFLAPIIKKVDGDGARLDDLTPIVWLSDEQQLEWIQVHRKLSDIVGFFGVSGKGFWKLYDKLSAEDKKLARSAEGLPIGNLDPQWLSDFVLTEEREELERSLSPDPDVESKLEQKLQSLADREALKSAVLKVEEKPETSWLATIRLPDGTLQPDHMTAEQGEAKRYQAILTVISPKEKKPVCWSMLNMTFPDYSPEREAELRKQKLEVGS